MRTRRLSSYLAGAALLSATPFASAHAQIESGRVIDDSTSAPLVGSRVVLQHDTAGTWNAIETTHTDAQGLFQFMQHAPGIYRVALLGKSDPMFFGAADTLAVDSMQQREFRLPITRRGEASAYLPSEVDHQAEALSIRSGQPEPTGELLASAATRTDVQFVVNADGSVDLGSIRVSSGNDPRMAETMRQSLMSRRYRPATIGGIPVRQVVSDAILRETRIERVERP